MKSILLLLSLFLSSESLALSKKRVVQPTPTPAVAVQPTPTPEVPFENLTYKCVKCTDAEKATIASVQKLIPIVINSPCFYDHFVLEKYRSQLIQTNGLTREEVVLLIRSAIVQEIPLVFYWPTLLQSKSVVGYTTANDPTIYLNRSVRLGSKWSLASEVSNLLHETTHKMGFDHDYTNTTRRPYSVPYTANFAVNECFDLVVPR